MRTFTVISKKKYDVVVIDSIGLEWLNYCIPEGLSICPVDIDKRLPIVKSLSFLYSLLKKVANNGVTSTSLLAAIIEELNPKVVITFIDDNKFMGPLQTLFPEKLIISIQNGLRLNDPNYRPLGKYLSFPNYFGFGEHELSMMKVKNASVAEYYSVGSLRMGIFLTHFYKPKRKPSHEICLISGYGRSVFNSSTELNVEYALSYNNICKFLSKFSKDNGIKITVAMRYPVNHEEFLDEQKYYEDNIGQESIVCFANDRKTLSAYQTGMDSVVVVSLLSTLMFELLGMGKKILCCGIANNNLAKILDTRAQCEKIPKIFLLEKWDYDEFESKLLNVLEMQDERYQSLIKDSKRYYMACSKPPPHEIIYNTLLSKFKPNRLPCVEKYNNNAK